METILHFLYQYIKFGKFTSCFLIVIGVILLLKLLPKIRFPLSKWAAFILILALGLFLRIEWLGYSSHTPQSYWNPKHMLENDVINVSAIDLTHGKWFLTPDGLPSGRRPIGYPIVLALCYKIFGVNLLVAWILNLALFGLTIFFLFLMAQKIFGEKIALITGLLFTIYPMSIYSIKLLTDEHLFLPVWYAGLFMLFRILAGRKIRLDWLWLGLIFGYATIIRTHAIFMPFVAGLTYWLIRRSIKKTFGMIFGVMLVMQIINVPWVIRNYKAWGVPVIYTATGSFVYSQVNSNTTPEGGGHIPNEGEPGYSLELDAAFQSGNEGKIHQVANREMSKWIRQHPIQFLELGTARLLNFMCFNRKSGVWAIWHQYYPGSFDPSRPLSQKSRKRLEDYAFAFYYVVFFSSFCAIIILIRRWKTLAPLTKNCLLILGACFFFWFLEHMIIFPDRKYRFPLEPLMLITTAYFFYNIHVPARLVILFRRWPIRKKI